MENIFSFTTILDYFASTWLSWANAVLVLCVFWLAGFTARRVLFRSLSRLAENTETQMDDVIIKKSQFHVLIWALLLGIYVAVSIAPISAASASFLHRAVTATFFISLTLMCANIAGGIMEVYGTQTGAGNAPQASLTVHFVRLVVIIIGLLMLLAHLGISIAPILTALGVGSLAVALALQDTLSNLFAGFYILANKQIRPGDYIRLDTGQEGVVFDIGWRSTRIKEPSGTIVIVPNAKIGSAIVKNFCLPSKELGFAVPVTVVHGSNLEKVEQITLEVAKEISATVAGVVTSAEPMVRFAQMGEYGVKFNVGFKAKEFGDQFLITHEFIKKLHERYRVEGIEIAVLSYSPAKK